MGASQLRYSLWTLVLVESLFPGAVLGIVLNQGDPRRAVQVKKKHPLPNVTLKGHDASTNQFILSKESEWLIQLRCESHLPNRWMWTEDDGIKIEVTKERIFLNKTAALYTSDLTVNFTSERDSDDIVGNFSCLVYSGNDMAPLSNLPVICVIVNQTGPADIQRTSVTIAQNLNIRQCLVDKTVSTNCSKLAIDLNRHKAKCEPNSNSNTTRLKRESCPDLDTCISKLWKDLHEDNYNCTGFQTKNLTGRAVDLSSPTLHQLQCSDGASVSSFVTLFPLFQANLWDTHRFSLSFRDAVEGNSLLIYVRPHVAISTNQTMPGVGHVSQRRDFAENETICVVCIAMRPLFMKGLRIRKGGPREKKDAASFVPKSPRPPHIDTVTDRYHIVERNVTLGGTKHGNMSWISCLAPVWNTEGWKVAVLNFSLFPSSLPTVSLVQKSTKEDRIQFTCAFGGWPRPIVTWHFNEALEVQHVPKESTEETENYHPNRTWHEVLIVNRTFKTFEVNCTVENFRGKVSAVQGVADRSVPLLYIILISCSVAVCGLSVILIIVVYRRYQAKLVLYAKQQQILTIEEVQEFYDGAPQSSAAMEALVLPYNSNYELPRDQLVLDGSVLGSGQFGQVLKATLGDRTVAVKTIKRNTDLMHFKSLLSELKILQFVGAHENIVNLIGAQTSDIRNRQVFLVLDYCSNGSLVSLLRHCRPRFVNFFSDTFDNHTKWPLYENSRDITLTTGNLITFATEIARAMDHLASKNVVHGDLACRNVLVTGDLHAKICDFGLSKQLRHYTVYVQKLDCPLPLRWMALESLQDMEFSLASDKWSYAVVLWEIFSLGEIPYPGVQWGFESYKMLQEGYRMSKPTYSNESIYQLMLKCWQAQPQERPNYQFIISQLEREEDLLT